MNRLSLVWFLLALTFANQCWAVKVGDVELPDRWQLGDQTLKLNGSGVREYGFFKVAVYAAALYSSIKSSDAQTLLVASVSKV